MATLVAHDRLPRISWGAVFAGIIISLAVFLVLGVLGTAIGASALAPLQYQDPSRGFAFGTGIWAVFMTVASVLAGADFARRSAPVHARLHSLFASPVVVPFITYVATSLLFN